VLNGLLEAKRVGPGTCAEGSGWEEGGERSVSKLSTFKYEGFETLPTRRVAVSTLMAASPPHFHPL